MFKQAAVTLLTITLIGWLSAPLQDRVAQESFIRTPALVSEPSRHVERLAMEATYYTWTGNRTATGTWPQEGRTVAVDPDVIPLGSYLIIDGSPGYVAEDTGGDINGNRIDIYLSDRDRCLELGRHLVEVEIVN